MIRISAEIKKIRWMMIYQRISVRLIQLSIIALVVSSGCSVNLDEKTLSNTEQPAATTQVPALELTQAVITVTPYPPRPVYGPGELVDYTAQTGDTLPAIATHFNTTVDEILAANTFIPPEATTMPPGMPMKIPIYYIPFWGSAYQIIPDSHFVNGPGSVGFDTSAFIASQSGWLNGYMEYAFNDNHTAGEIIDFVAQQFSISPRLLLALLDYQVGGLSELAMPEGGIEYVLGYENYQYKGLYMQLVWAANLLNNGYYQWRSGDLVSFDMLDERLVRPDPWQNAASVAIQHYFSKLYTGDLYDRAIAHDGLGMVYKELFGDPWQTDAPHIPGSLTQPEFRLPFNAGVEWAFTGGPHTGYGQGEPFAALDFAPGSIKSGCTPTDEWATAVADGVIARSETGTVVLDLDGDGDERTGWILFYFHIGTEGRATTGRVVKAGEPIGYPSCEGGRATGTHIHVARKYNGEWILASGVLAFNLEGWVAQGGANAYQGTLIRNARVITACDCSDAASQIMSGVR